MKNLILVVFFCFFTGLIFNHLRGSMVGLGGFNKEVWSAKDFNEIVMNDVKINQSILAKESTSSVAGLSVELPDKSMENSIISIYSYVKSDYVYVGPYKKIMIISIVDGLLKNKDSPDYDGFDILTISFIDTRHKITYTCTQEKLYKVWEQNKIATVHLLGLRQPDKNGQPMCYSIHISGDL